MCLRVGDRHVCFYSHLNSKAEFCERNCTIIYTWLKTAKLFQYFGIKMTFKRTNRKIKECSKSRAVFPNQEALPEGELHYGEASYPWGDPKSGVLQGGLLNSEALSSLFRATGRVSRVRSFSLEALFLSLFPTPHPFPSFLWPTV